MYFIFADIMMVVILFPGREFLMNDLSCFS